MKENLTLMTFLLTLSLAISSCQSLPVNETSTSKEIIEIHATYPQVNMEQICDESSAIVHGIVTERGETFLYNISLEDEPLYRAYTPYTVEVIDWYKGYTGETTVTYLRTGGETDTTIYNSIEPDFEPGTEVILFLSETGASWPTRGTYQVEDGKIEMLSDMLPEVYSSEETSEFVEIDITDFSSIISETLDQ